MKSSATDVSLHVMQASDAPVRKSVKQLLPIVIENLSRPYPGEPADVTARERRVLWLHANSSMNNLHDIAERKATGTVFWLCGIATTLAGAIVTAICLRNSELNLIGPFVFLPIGIWLTNVAHNITGRKEAISIFDMTTSENWTASLLASLVQLKEKTEIDPALSAFMIHLGEKNAQDTLSSNLSTTDVVGLLRLKERVDVILKRMMGTAGVRLDGNTQELVGRALEALDPDGCTLAQLTSKTPLAL